MAYGTLNSNRWLSPQAALIFLRARTEDSRVFLELLFQCLDLTQSNSGRHGIGEKGLLNVKRVMIYLVKDGRSSSRSWIVSKTRGSNEVNKSSAIFARRSRWLEFQSMLPAVQGNSLTHICLLIHALEGDTSRVTGYGQNYGHLSNMQLLGNGKVVISKFGLM